MIVRPIAAVLLSLCLVLAATGTSWALYGDEYGPFGLTGSVRAIGLYLDNYDCEPSFLTTAITTPCTRASCGWPRPGGHRTGSSTKRTWSRRTQPGHPQPGPRAA